MTLSVAPSVDKATDVPKLSPTPPPVAVNVSEIDHNAADRLGEVRRALTELETMNWPARQRGGIRHQLQERLMNQRGRNSSEKVRQVRNPLHKSPDRTAKQVHGTSSKCKPVASQRSSKRGDSAIR